MFVFDRLFGKITALTKVICWSTIRSFQEPKVSVAGVAPAQVRQSAMLLLLIVGN